MENTFIATIENLRNLLEIEKNEEFKKRNKNELSFLTFCENLKILYNAEQKRVYEKYITPFIEKNSFLKEQSVLEIINKHSWETYHSLILKYIWENPNYLATFIYKTRNINDKECILSHISKKEYEIQVEHTTSTKKRIDLLIVDAANKWLIAIENKIHSDVSKNQLDNYSKYLESNKEFKSFPNKIYILLSFKDNRISVEDKKWLYVDYFQVFSAMLDNNPTDPIIIDYLKSLYRLIFDNREMSKDSTLSLYRARNFYIEVQSKIK